MRTKIIEATQGSEFNWGKFLVGTFDDEYQHKSHLPIEGDERMRELHQGIPLLRQRGYSGQEVLVLDLETKEGAIFQRYDGSPAITLNSKHKLWVCPMYEPFLVWLLGEAEWTTLDDLPHFVRLDTQVAAMFGYRRGQSS